MQGGVTVGFPRGRDFLANFAVGGAWIGLISTQHTREAIKLVACLLSTENFEVILEKNLFDDFETVVRIQAKIHAEGTETHPTSM